MGFDFDFGFKIFPLKMKKCSGNSIWIGISIVATLLVASIRAYAVRKSRDNRPPGSVTDLVRRGQLRSGDRRGMYETHPLFSSLLIYCFKVVAFGL